MNIEQFRFEYDHAGMFAAEYGHPTDGTMFRSIILRASTSVDGVPFVVLSHAPVAAVTVENITRLIPIRTNWSEQI